MATKKLSQNRVDQALEKLSPQDLEDFQKLTRFNPKYSTVREWFKERGFEISHGSIGSWWAANKPRGKEAALVSGFAETFRGCEPSEMLELGAGVTATIIKLLYEDLDPTVASGNVKLQSILEALRELRQTSETIANQTQTKEREASEFDGAIALRNYLIKVFKETSFEDPLMIAIEEFLVEKFGEIS
jgi:hypothetical protein